MPQVLGEANFFQPCCNIWKIWTPLDCRGANSELIHIFELVSEKDRKNHLPLKTPSDWNVDHPVWACLSSWFYDILWNVTVEPKSDFRSDWGQYQRNAVLTKHSQRVTGRWFWGFQGSACLVLRFNDCMWCFQIWTGTRLRLLQTLDERCFFLLAPLHAPMV